MMVVLSLSLGELSCGGIMDGARVEVTLKEGLLWHLRWRATPVKIKSWHCAKW